MPSAKAWDVGLFSSLPMSSTIRGKASAKPSRLKHQAWPKSSKRSVTPACFAAHRQGCSVDHRACQSAAQGRFSANCQRRYSAACPLQSPVFQRRDDSSAALPRTCGAGGFNQVFGSGRRQSSEHGSMRRGASRRARTGKPLLANAGRSSEPVKRTMGSQEETRRIRASKACCNESLSLAADQAAGSTQ